MESSASEASFATEDDTLFRIDFEAFIASLPRADREIARLRFVDLLDVDQIVAATGRGGRNPVDQSLFRTRRAWKQWLES